MARYRGPVGRLCRREGVHLYLSNKCYTKKCPLERRGTPPGQHGVRRRKMSNYGLQLREKQRVRRMYMVNERPFKRL
jgi:small subunit ribosomal protein S4